MATPVGHSIVGYTLARAAGVRSPRALGVAVLTASLPDIDFLVGRATQGDFFSLHHEVITHRPVFPAIVGAAVALGAIAFALLRGRRPRARDVFPPAALAAGLVASHVLMDNLPLPYDGKQLRKMSLPEAIASQSWNAVIDMAFYGTAAALIFERNGKRAE